MRHLANSAIILAFLLAPMRVFAITYDMVVDATSIVTVPSKPHVGQIAKVYVTVHSIGKEDVEGIVVWNDGDKLIGRKSLSLKAGGSDEDVWTTWFPTTSGTHLIRVNIVNDPGYPDASPENNVAERAIVVEGDPATSTKQQTSLTTTSTAAVSVTTSTTAQTIPVTSLTTQKSAAAPPTGQQTTSVATFLGKQSSRARSSWVLNPPPTVAKNAQETRTKAEGGRDMVVAVPTTTMLAIATSVTQINERAERAQSATSSLTPKKSEVINASKPRTPFNLETALWIGTTAGALLAVLFYIIARRRDERSSD